MLAVIPQVGKRVEVVGLVQCLQVAGISLFIHGRYLNVNYLPDSRWITHKCYSGLLSSIV